MERLRWAGNVAHQGVMQNYSLRTRKEQTPGIGRKVILKLILKKEGGGGWTGFMWSRAKTGSYDYNYETSGSIKREIF
jgi:hypothetical protein